MARQRYVQAAPGECASASPQHWECTAPSFRTGVEGFIDAPASSCFANSAWRSEQSLGMPPSPSLPRRFPGQSGLMLAFRGYSGWLAIGVPELLGRSRSTCSASPNGLLPRSAWLQLELDRKPQRGVFFPRTAILLQAETRGIWLTRDEQRPKLPGSLVQPGVLY